jgi:uncharacterized protein
MGRAAAKPLWILFAHGAGAPASSPWMKHYASLLERFGPVESFNYTYMQAGLKRPDSMIRLLTRHREALREGRARHGNNVLLAGKSMGGRIGCHLAREEEVLGVLCLGYPLKGMGSTGKLRDQVLLDLKTPACFIQGTRDKLCPLDLMEATLKKRQAPSTLHIVESGDHSLEPTKTHLKQNSLQVADLEAASMAVVAEFIRSLPDDS